MSEDTVPYTAIDPEKIEALRTAVDEYNDATDMRRENLDQSRVDKLIWLKHQRFLAALEATL